MTVSQIQPMGVGELLDRSFQVLRQHIGPLFITALIGTAPYVIVMAGAMTPAAADGSGESVAAAMIIVGAVVLMFLTTAIVWGALAHQVEAALAGRPVTVGDGLRNGLRHMWRLIGAGLGAYFLLMGLMVPGALIGFAAAFFGGQVAGGGVAGVVLTVLAFAIPLGLAVVVWTALTFLVLPAVVIEGAGPIKGLRRGNQLAKGGRLRVFLTALVSYVVILLPTAGLPFLFGVGAEFWAPEVAGTVASTRLYLANGAVLLAGGVTTPFLVAVMVHSYYDRRVRREGYDVELMSPMVATEA
jgi:hypothetical protein